MAKQIFINLAVKDLQKSMDFYTALGFSNNPQFSDETAKCMVWSENIFVMLMTYVKFKTFGFMQQRTIEDYDGHTWEVFYMDISKFPKAHPKE